MPDKITSISKDHHSAQIITVAGIERVKYCPQSLNESRVGRKIAYRISSMHHALIVMIKSIVKYVIAVAIPRPGTPS